ncbi:chondroitin sulfate proteoglycan 4-like [Amphibalanus amphitrite]|uniref:chondroitin sulfate proteoglycan 4-like n=1 Tax=Amphibalanus amphitrite TaxID=1232801 RepID=UPI001C926AF4|nr:chondroitin sulfate proteoglycan 4-like [Amphibalanus amphitrite]
MLLEGGLLKVRINLGAGEGEVTSPSDRRLDDLLWHDVQVQRNNADLALTIDGVHVTRIELPGRFYELNIHYGVFVGGMGDFSEIFLGLLDNFRGCLHQVRFNEVEILAQARDRNAAHHVTWGCDKQFDADADVSMSFVDERSYAMMPSLLPRVGGTIRLDLKTSVADGLVVYNDAGRRGPDHLIVALRDGRLSMELHSAGRTLQLNSRIAINDGVWHKTQLTISAEYVELTVDQTLTSVKPENQSDFKAFISNFFVGGLSEKNRLRASKQGITNLPLDFRGCVQNLLVNGELTGFPSVVESLGVRAECVWEYPCLRDPCVSGGVCVPQGVSEFRCECDQAVCVRADFAGQHDVFADTRLPDDLQLLSLTPLSVPEGGEVLLTSANIHVVLDYEKYGVRDSGVFFHVREPPKQGALSVDVWRRPDESVFTLLDLISDRVHYLHGGDESAQDVIVFELELFARAGFTLPEYLQARHRFVLQVAVSPVNDRPRLVLPPGASVRMAAGTRRTLDSDILRAEDPDSRPRQLVYTLTSPTDVSGHVELDRHPGVPVQSFTQEQVDDGLVQFVHEGSDDTKLALRVSDGQAASDTAVLKIVVFRLEAVPANNTGLRLTHGASALITPANLSFTTNAQEEDMEIKYVIVKQTQDGKIQKLRGNGRWQPTGHFTQRHLQRGRVRYRHTSGTPTHDGFKFQVTLRDSPRPTVYDFRIEFLLVSIKLTANVELVLNRSQEAVVSNKFLQADALPFSQPAANISFEMVSTPRFGELFRLEGSPARRQVLPTGAVFTQRDIDTSRILYRLHRKSYSAFTDQFRFRVRIPGFESHVHEFNMRHVPPAPKGMISIKRIEVGEGDAVAITPKLISIEIDGITTVFYNVTDPPQHGKLRSASDAEPLGHFTSQEMAEGRVLYAHDDSEHPSDTFSFVATSLNPDDDFQYVGAAEVVVVMRNDNAPRRTATRTLYVVRNGRRAVRPAELTFSDRDLYTEPSDIEYTRRGIPNGALYLHPDYNTEVFRFTQSDIDSDRLVFQHAGDDRARLVLWVSDGTHFTTGVLDVVASAPFVRLNTTETPLTVPRGDTKLITADALRPETNVEVTDENVRFAVTTPPQRGRLRVSGEPAEAFSFRDVQLGAVEYESSGGSGTQDSIHFAVQVGKLKSNGSLQFRIFPESYWEPLRVVNNRSALVAEGEMVTVSQSLLHVMHPNVAPGDIRFTVTRGPSHGFLMLRGPDARPKVITFDQAFINDGNLSYVQSVANATEDSFEFSVTNGIVSLPSLLFRLLVIPVQVRLVTRNMTLSEGGRVALSPHALTVASEYYRRRVAGFDVLGRPRHGRLELAGRQDVKLQHFTAQQLSDGHVTYVHSGDESRGDCLTLVALADTKTSAPGQLCFTISGVNDHPPSLVNNTGITVVQGGSVLLTTHQLDAVDADRPEKDLVFSLGRSECGNISLLTAPNVTVANFSRSQLDAGEVVFSHTRPDVSRCSVLVTVSDGVHRTPPERLTVLVERLQLRLVANTRLHVFPMMQQSITKGHLLVGTNDPRTPRTITYSVIRKPRLGKITREQPDGSTVEVSWFTQQDLNRSLVLYEHQRPLAGLSASDSVELRVETPPAEPLTSVVLEVAVSVTTMTRGGLRRYVDGVPLRLPEGGAAGVSRAVLDVSGVAEFLRSHSAGQEAPQVRIRLTTPPRHGQLRLEPAVGASDGSGGSLSGFLTQEDINAGRLSYRHDHSDTLTDSFGYSLFLATSASDVLLYNGTVNVTVVPVNDQKFRLETPAPGVSVVQKQTASITTRNLQVTDPDNAPSEILYTIISGPSRGRVFLRGQPHVRVSNFSQADVDAERLLYAQDGSLGSDQFLFSVWDGVHSPLMTSFGITVVPLSLTIARNLPLRLPQGQSRVTLKPEQVSADTNGMRSEIVFNVTREPTRGRLFIGADMVTTFSQADVDAGRVSYLQMDLSAPNDSFAATVYNEFNGIRNETFVVLATPLVAMTPLRCAPGQLVLLSLAVLNATELASRTNSNPRYQLLEPPRHGRVTQIVPVGDRRKRRETRAWNVTSFTHADVTQNVIFFVAAPADLTGNQTLSDAVRFELTASGVQPARGELQVRLLSEAALEAEKATPGVNSVVGRGRPQDSSSFIRSDYVLVAGVVIGVVVTSILLLIVVKCITDRRRRAERKARELGPAPLTELPPSESPRTVSRATTPDFINSTLPRPSISTLPRPRISVTGGSLPRPRHLEQPRLLEPGWPERDVSPCVPQCTVTPLYTGAQPADVTYSYDVDADRQFCGDDWSQDGSDISASQPSNPILRKNQYWV